MAHTALRDQSIITAPHKSNIDETARQILRSSFPPRLRSEKLNIDGELESIAIPRRDLRRLILTDQSFRRSFRQLSVQVQDLYVKRAWQFWGQGGLGERMEARTYVSDVKAFGQAKGSLLGGTLSQSLRGLQERLDSMARWAQVIVLAGTMGACVGSAIYLARKAMELIEVYSEGLSAAIESEDGLDRAIRARSGTSRPVRSSAEGEPNAATKAAENP